MRWVTIIFLVVLMMGAHYVIKDLKHQIITLQLDRDEVKQHTDILAGIVKT